MSDEIIITNNNRRHFIKVSLIGLTLAPVGNLLLSHNAQARGNRAVTGGTTQMAKLPENDRQAAALGYKEDATSVDNTKYKIVEGATCRNCQLYSGSEEDEWGPCAIFSYRVDPIVNKNYEVSAKGWCRSWAPRA
jgi:hypothetical protein